MAVLTNTEAAAAAAAAAQLDLRGSAAASCSVAALRYSTVVKAETFAISMFQAATMCCFDNLDQGGLAVTVCLSSKRHQDSESAVPQQVFKRILLFTG
jgi:hypothetical protein